MPAYNDDTINGTNLLMEMKKFTAGMIPFKNVVAFDVRQFELNHFKDQLFGMGWSRPFVDVFLFTPEGDVMILNSSQWHNYPFR